MQKYLLHIYAIPSMSIFVKTPYETKRTAGIYLLSFTHFLINVRDHDRALLSLLD
jgi:hypothetical protein